MEGSVFVDASRQRELTDWISAFREPALGVKTDSASVNCLRGVECARRDVGENDHGDSGWVGSVEADTCGATTSERFLTGEMLGVEESGTMRWDVDNLRGKGEGEGGKGRGKGEKVK